MVDRGPWRTFAPPALGPKWPWTQETTGRCGVLATGLNRAFRTQLEPPRVSWHVALMDLDYSETLADDLIDALEEAARAVGLPLSQLELLGQHPAHAEAFVQHVRSGTHDGFLDRIDWSGLEVLRTHGWQPGLSGPGHASA